MADDALDEMKAEAVKRGAAEWVVNPANGKALASLTSGEEVEP